jgi:hypothetical protein
MSSYKNFTYPLNAYAHILCKDYGGFEYLHYGLFEQNNQDIKIAQQRSTELLFAHLPPSPCRILEVGIGLGTTLSKLLNAGYDALGITPDENQIQYAKNVHGDSFPVFCERLEDFSDGQKFDLILFQESAQYIDTTSLFQAAAKLLRAEGQIIIMDEISLNQPLSSEPSLPFIDNYITTGNTFGFEVTKQLDLSKQASPQMYLMDSVTRHREGIALELNLPIEDINGLIKAIKIHLDKYLDGRYGYCFLQLKKKSPGQRAWITEWANPEHEAEILDLFRDAFGHEMSQQQWRWKYRGLDIQGVLVRCEGKVVAFYGGMPRAVHLFGSPATAVQIGDVMVHPQERGFLKRKGPFFLAASTFSERFVGNNKAYSLAFGFPSERAYRLGARLGLYEQVGEIKRVTWPAIQARPSLKIRIRPLKTDQHTEVDQLWAEMSTAFNDQVIGTRNWDYIQQRYLNHPTLSYQIFLVSSRWSGKPVGIFVVRILEDSVELLDLIAQPKYIPILVGNACRLAWNLNKPQVFSWITAQHAPLLAGRIGEITPLNIPLPNICWMPGIPASELQDRWWLMGGDSDFR